MKRGHQGFTLIEVVVSLSISVLIFAAALSTQSSTMKSFKNNEPISSIDSELSRLGSAIEKDLRRAKASTLEVPGSPFPTAPATGTTYNSLNYRIVRYDEVTQQTLTDATVCSLTLVGSNLEILNENGTMQIGPDVTALGVTYDSAAKTVAVTITVRRTMPDNTTQTRSKVVRVQLRNS